MTTATDAIADALAAELSEAAAGRLSGEQLAAVVAVVEVVLGQADPVGRARLKRGARARGREAGLAEAARRFGKAAT